MYRRTDGVAGVLLAHPGGPSGAAKTKGAWTIPKGEYDQNEAPQAAAIREFGEETGFAVCRRFYPLERSCKKAENGITAWAFAGDCDPARYVPTRSRSSGRRDRGA
jgi:predicted NUDIX family NTP pyrophosphohydrolase